ncbi:MAG: dihydropteroate synthase [Deltaproteobacteria bacterium]|nr:dihydropteroate synthase [Deltaproteobacteria bacterium]
MGVLNVTPDSFSDGGRWPTPDQAVARALAMAREGAQVVDVGGASSRPGAVIVPPEKEIQRSVPVVRALTRRLSEQDLSVAVSIDTSQVEVAKAALEAGATVINDVSGLADPAMARLAAAHQAVLVLCHNGLNHPLPEGLVPEDTVEYLVGWLGQRAEQARQLGAHLLVIDPGFGFGKTIEQNLAIITGLRQFSRLGWPVLVGASRKGSLGKLLLRSGLPDPGPQGRLGASLAMALAAAERGAAILRVHDVAATCQALALANLLSLPPTSPPRLF